MLKPDLRAKVVSANLLSLPRRTNFLCLFKKLLIFLFAFSLSFQVGLKVDASQAYTFGFLTDYFIFSLHPSEIIAILLILLTLSKNFFRPISFRLIPPITLLLVIVVCWFVISPNTHLLILGLLNICLFLSVFFFTIHLTSSSSKKLKNFLEIFTLGLVSGLIICTSIGLIQFFSGISPNIPLLGSYSFSSTTPNIALGEIFDYRFLRAYGTTPHPNIFSALTVCALGFLLYPSVWILLKKKVKILYLLVVAILLVGILISFSRTGIVMTLVLLLVRFKSIFGRTGKLLYPLFFILLITLLIFISNLGFQSKSVTERFELNLIGLKVFSDNLILGVGPKNYLIAAQDYFFQSFNLRLFQPPHNTLILFLAEYGLAGFVLCFKVLIKPIKSLIFTPTPLSQYLLKPLFFAILIGFSFDHYFLTQFQTSLLFAVIVGLIFTHSKMLDLK